MFKYAKMGTHSNIVLFVTPSGRPVDGQSDHFEKVLLTTPWNRLISQFLCSVNWTLENNSSKREIFPTQMLLVFWTV